MTARAFAPPRLFTATEYHRMAEAGILAEDDRVELIEGEIIATSPIGPRHAACVKKIAGWIRDLLSGTPVVVGVQDPVRLSDDSEPQPDLSIVRTRDDFYAAGHPGPEDILLLIEVADASVIYDRNTKLPLYARSGVREVWLIDLVTNTVEVRSSPSGSGYLRTQRFGRGPTVISTELPDLRMEASEILIT